MYKALNCMCMYVQTYVCMSTCMYVIPYRRMVNAHMQFDQLWREIRQARQSSRGDFRASFAHEWKFHDGRSLGAIVESDWEYCECVCMHVCMYVYTYIYWEISSFDKL